MARPKTITQVTPYTPARGKLAGQTFYSQRQLDNAYARLKAGRPIKREADYRSLPDKSKEAYRKSLTVLARVRHHDSLTRASTEVGIDPTTVKKYVGSALEKREARYIAAEKDTLLRARSVLTTNGFQRLVLENSRAARIVREHDAAIQHFLLTGDASDLKKFAGKGVRSEGKFYRFETDPQVIDELYHAQSDAFEELLGSNEVPL